MVTIAQGEEIRRLLEAGDVEGLRLAWAQIAPHYPQPSSFEEAEIAMHVNRTAAESVNFRSRAFSHAWLTERGMPSQLPDKLRPKAERVYPRTASAVAVIMATRSELMKPAIPIIRKEICDAVEDVYAEGKGDNIPLVKQRMDEAKAKAVKKLFGRLLWAT